jgi:SET domain-containing protein
MCRSNILYIDKSNIEGRGLFCKKDLKIGECVGLLARVYGDDKFDDKPFGRYINHFEDSNLDLKIVSNLENRIIYVLGVANKYISKGNELTANYKDKNAPKPNFITNRSYNFEKKLNKF